MVRFAWEHARFAPPMYVPRLWNGEPVQAFIVVVDGAVQASKPCPV